MTPKLRDRIDDLFAEAVDLEPGQRPTFLDRACAGAPGLRAAVVALLADHDRAEAASFLDRPACNPLAAGADDDPPGSAAAPPRHLAGYEILGELGRGGMGVVYRARQPGLKRVVALKMILDGDSARPDDLLRFVGEAEMLARVAHPNIVHIYEVGRHEGRPFFAMEYVEGGSLADQLSGTPLPGRRAAELAEALARAVQAAHEAGIVHRDLKPSNILLTGGGVPKVMDFGLARRLEAAGGLTQSGMIMGTPSYMAPEQAQGKLSAIGPACDIYALGAVLYECLTGRPPFRAENVLETLSLVVHQEPVPPRVLQPRVPRDLETICLKCLQKDAGKRYASALDLAEDLRRFRAGEPIRARPVGTVERVGRWGRRNPWVAGLLAMLALVLSGAFGSVTALWLQAEQQRALAGRERDRAQANLERADANLGKAKQAVDECFLLAAKDPLLQADEMRPVRQLLLEKALPFYQGFQAERQEDPAIQAELARNYTRVAYITEVIGRPEDAVAAYGRAGALWTKLATDHPDVTEYESGLASTCCQLGLLQRKTGQAAAALQSFREAQTIQTTLVARDPSAANLVGLAETYNGLALLQDDTGPPADALRSWERARDLQARVAAALPDAAPEQAFLAAIHQNIGRLQRQLGQRDAALHSFEQALAIQAKVAARNPLVDDFRSLLSRIYTNLAVAQDEAGSPATALKSLEQARVIDEQLVARFPEVARHREGLGAVYDSLSDLQSKLNQPDAALRSQEHAQRIQAQLAADHPKVLGYQFRLATSYDSLGNLHCGRDRGAALNAYDRARRLLARLADEHPAVDAYQIYLSRTLCHLANLHSDTDPAAALRCYGQARQIQADLVARYSENPIYQRDLGRTYLGLGNLYDFDLRKPDEALRWFGQAVPLWEALWRNDPVRDLEGLRDAYRGRARALSSLGRHADAAEAWERVLAVAAEPARATFRAVQAIEVAYVGRHVQATATAEELARQEDVTGATLYNAACVYAVSSAAVRQDRTRPAAERDRLAERYVAQSLNLLARAKAAGRLNGRARVDDLEKDKDLDALRPRAEFQDFLRRLRD
jgi:tetratricopeptide (TPR) repeat protein/predicted Ser/Thr protein kinase